jgi:hypothetical protein
MKMAPPPLFSHTGSLRHLELLLQRADLPRELQARLLLREVARLLLDRLPEVGGVCGDLLAELCLFGHGLATSVG